MGNQEQLEILKQGGKTVSKKLNEAVCAAYGWNMLLLLNKFSLY